MTKTVVYISSCALYADGIPNTFLLQELPWLRSHFNRVLICSIYGVAEIGENRPRKVNVSRSARGALRAYMKAPFRKEFRSAIGDLRKAKRLTIVNFLKLLAFTIRGLKLYHWFLPAIREEEQTTIYSYWMSYDGYAAALCKQDNPWVRAIARGHAFDIDVKRNPMNPYLMKRVMARTLDSIYPISQYAKEQILAYADVPSDRIKVVGVGSAGEESDVHFSAPRFDDGIYHVVSCSMMIRIKQIPLLIDALAGWEKCKLHWVHIGGGAEEEAVRAYAGKRLAEHPFVTYELTGSLPPERVSSLYQKKPFDVFINTSKNEGTPVSIMEALHAGIPVVAPQIGGIPELIDDSIGCLFPKDGDTDDIIYALCTIYEKSKEETQRMRAAAQTRWGERCAIHSLMPELFPDDTEDIFPK